MLLLNPGPVTLSERVRNSLLGPDLCHRESEFYDLQDEIRARLLATHDLDPSEWSAVLMTASGTAAVESMVAALVPEGGRLLIIENGVYGERIAQICAMYRIAHERLIGSWMSGPDLAAVASAIDAATGAQRFSHVAVVHHETTTGRLTNLAGLLALCGARNIQLLVDGVSSFGAELIDFADPALAAVAATANKCLHGVPGASFVIARRSALATAAARTFYLDLNRLGKLQDQRGTPFTPSIQVYYALREALCEFAEAGGRAARYAQYAAFAEKVRAGLAGVGIFGIIPAAESSVVLRSYALPAGVTYATLHDALKADGFVIYAGQGDLSKSLFRVSTMGHLTSADLDRLIRCFARWQR
jgi:2-aminoethylphosphonate-pyruvate transaminase